MIDRAQDVSLAPSGERGIMRVLVDGEDVGLVVRTDADHWRTGGYDYPTQDAAAYAAALRRASRGRAA